MSAEIPQTAPGISKARLTFFDRITCKTGTPVLLEEVMKQISTGKFKETIDLIRTSNDKRERDKLKKMLPAVTISGLFTGQRKAEDIDQHSGLLQLDFDKVSELQEKIESLRADKYCAAVFLSPSGDGIKAIVPIVPEQHAEAFYSLSVYFKRKYNLSADPSCKDVSRLMFISYDPDLTYKPGAAIWNSETETRETILSLIEKLSFSIPFSEGNRNNSCFKLALACRQENIDRRAVEIIFVELFVENGFDQHEILNVISSAWKQEKIFTQNASKTNHGKTVEGYTKIHEVENFITERYELRLNIVSQCLEYRDKYSAAPFMRLNENSLYRQLQHNRIDIGMGKLQSLLLSDFVSIYNPFEYYFESLGKYVPEQESNYIGQLMQFIKTKDPARFERHFRKMLVRTIASALEDRIFNKHAFILVQRKQNSGKSTFCRWLCPPALSDYITENINTDKDSLISLATNYIINLDELATLSRTEINSLKSFMSKDKINARLPYDRKATIHPRRASFVGSTNQLEFLTDETGSVRWLCFEIEEIDFNYKTVVDINMLWKQAYYLYQSDFLYNLTAAEIEENEIANKSFQIQTSEMEWVNKLFIQATKETGGQFMQATDISKYIEDHKQVYLKPQAIGKALRQLGFESVSGSKENISYSLKGYWVKILGG